MSMFARLFLLIALVSGVSLGLVAEMLWRNSGDLERQLREENTEVGERVVKSGSMLLEQNLRDTHQMILRQQASKVESYFSSIGQAVQLEAALAQQFLAGDGAAGAAPPLFEANTLTGRARRDPSLLKTLVGRQPYAIYRLAPSTSRRLAQPGMRRLRQLGGFFAHTQKNLAGCDSSYFGSESGFILGYPGGLTYFKDAYDPRSRPWYKQAMAKSSLPGALNWIVNLDRDGKTLYLTCARTVTLVGSISPVGVAAIDVRLPIVQQELFNIGTLGTLRVSKAILVDESGHVLIDASLKGRKLSFDRKLLSSTRVDSLRGFEQVARHIRDNPGLDSDIYWNNRERDAGMADSDSVFIYSSIRFASGAANVAADGAAGRGRWRYIVQLPVKSLLQPIHSVRDKMQNATSDISRAIQSRTRQSALLVLGVIGLALLASLAAAYFAARSTARPLIQMASVARAVGAGRLDQAATERGGGEIGEMGRAINAMIRGLRQRDLLKESFGQFTAPSVVDKLLREGGARVGGDKKRLTVFFSDLEGFTTLAEATEPQVLVGVLNEYFEAMTAIIMASEGTLDKYIGDAILAFWGDPIAHEDDAARACRAALEQFEMLQVLGNGWQQAGRPRLSMRIGIESGDVIVGNVGSSQKLNYTVLGDTVNFSSRLEAVNKIYGTRILIGEQARRAAGAAIHVREIDLLAVAGKHQSVRVYELLGMAGQVSPAQLEGCASYEAALAAYRQMLWTQSREHLARAQQVMGGDRPSQVLLERIEKLQIDPPPPGWDGSFVLEHK